MDYPSPKKEGLMVNMLVHHFATSSAPLMCSNPKRNIPTRQTISYKVLPYSKHNVGVDIVLPPINFVCRQWYAPSIYCCNTNNLTALKLIPTAEPIGKALKYGETMVIATTYVSSISVPSY